MSRREERERLKQEKRDKQRDRLAKSEFAPNPQKQPKSIEGENYEEQTVQWCFEVFDYQTDWREKQSDGHVGFCDVAEHLKAYSSKTWREIRADPERDHPCEIDKICKQARDRLIDLRLDDTDELWRFRFSAKRRIWGFKIGRMFRVLWWDPDHRVYPSPLRNT